ncbi:hypothetical protein C8J57DRAFT_1232291 [Mycena rebaudengoi]|nr:hypothetical protein C8J57DRAFT_1232291 [Mycena rebaudengoi]
MLCPTIKAQQRAGDQATKKETACVVCRDQSQRAMVRKEFAMGASGLDMVGGRREAFGSGHAERKDEQSEYMQTGGKFLDETLVELGTEQKDAIKTATATAIQKQRRPCRGAVAWWSAAGNRVPNAERCDQNVDADRS